MPDMDIDKLNIEISASANKANKSLDQLITKLTSLSHTLQGVNPSGLQGLANGMSSLGNSLQSFKGIGEKRFTNLANSINQLARIDGARLSASANGLNAMSNALSGIASQSKSIETFTASIKSLGGAGTQKAIANLPLLANSLKRAMTILSTAPMVSRNVIDLANALSRLSGTSIKIGNSTSGLNNFFRTAQNGATSTTKSMKSLAYYFGKFYANFWLLRRAIGLLKESISYSSDLAETQNVVDNVFGKERDKVEELSQIANQYFGMSELTTKKVASTFQAMAVAMGVTNQQVKESNSTWDALDTKLSNTSAQYNNTAESIADMSLNMTKLAADIASFRNKEVDEVAQQIASGVYSGQARALREYGLDLTQATVQEWALNQGLEANFKTMTQSEKTMLRYQYVLANSENIQSDFIRTANSWANVTKVINQNFQNLGKTIGEISVNAFKPFMIALNNVIIKLNEFSVMVANSLGKIFGWKYEESALGDIASDSEDLSDGLSDATDNAKALKSQLQGFDKLNNLSSNNKTSGSGTSTSTNSSSKSGEWTQTDSMFKSYESDISSLEELGSTISEKLTNALKSIDWEDIYQSATNFGSGLASFLNGLITPELFGELGKTIASALNTAIKAALGYGETFDFENFGSSIASGINNFFETFEFDTLAETLNTWADGLWETLKTAFSEIKWIEIFNGLKDFLLNLDSTTINLFLGLAAFKNLKSVLKSSITSGTSGISIIPKIAIAKIVWDIGFDVGKSLGKKLFPEDAQAYDDFSWKGFVDAIEYSIANDELWDNVVGTAKETLKKSLKKAGLLTEEIEAKIDNTEVENPVKKGTSIILDRILGEDKQFTFEDVLNFPNAQELMLASLGVDTKGIWQVMTGEKTITEVLTNKNQVHSGGGSSFSTMDEAIVEAKARITSVEEDENLKTPNIDSTANLTRTKDNIDKQEKKNKLKFDANLTRTRDLIDKQEKKSKLKFTANLNKFSDVITKAKELNGYKGKINNYDDVIKKAKNLFSFNADIDDFSDSISIDKKYVKDFKILVSTLAPTDGLKTKIEKNGLTSQLDSIFGFATGGFPDTADLFYANENGVPELVGTVGGKTAVASGKEITGISDAIYETSAEERALMGEFIRVGRALLAKDYGISNKEIFDSVRNSNDSYIRKNGHSAFAY